MKRLTSFASILAVAALGALPLRAADMLVNGDFNTGDLTGWWTYVPDAANSSVSVLPGDAFSLDGSPYVWQMAHNATGDPILGQDIDVAGGAQYSVSLAYRANNWGGAGLGIWYFDSSWTQIAQYEWAGLYSGAGTDTGWVSFTSPQWTAPANAAHLEVRLDAWGWSDTFYDNVSVEVVPEPGICAMLGLGGLLLVWRRKALPR